MDRDRRIDLEREPRPPKDEAINLPTLYTGRDVFKSDQPQRVEPPLRTKAGPGTYETAVASMVTDAHRASMSFATRSRSSGWREPDWAGQSPRTTSRGARLSRPLTADLDFISADNEILNRVRPIPPSSHGVSWPKYAAAPPLPPEPGSEVLSEAHQRPEGSLAVSLATSSRNYTATFTSAQERFAPAPRLEHAQLGSYDYLGTADGMKAREPKRGSSAFRSGSTLGGSSSTSSLPGAGRRRSRHAEPYGGGDWVVPRVPPPPLPRRRRPPKGMVTSSSASSIVPRVPTWDKPTPKGAINLGSVGGGRVGERFELLPEGLYSTTLHSIITY